MVVAIIGLAIPMDNTTLTANPAVPGPSTHNIEHREVAIQFHHFIS